MFEKQVCCLQRDKSKCQLLGERNKKFQITKRVQKNHNQDIQNTHQQSSK